MAPKKYLVTGGSGFIGSALVHRLVNDGLGVRILDNNSRGAVQKIVDIQSKIEFIHADIRDSAAVDKAIQGVDAVCHLAFVNGTEFFYSKPDLVLDVGIKGMMNVIDSCIKNNVGELIVASSSEVYQTPKTIPADEGVQLIIPDPHNPRYSYAAGKILSEIMAINFGRKYFQRVLIFRPHNVYGPDMGSEHVIPQLAMRMRKLIQEGHENIKIPIQGTGQETRAFVYIDDFISGLMTVIEHGEHLGIYNIGTMDEVPIKGIVKMIGEYYKKNVDVISGKNPLGSVLRRCPDMRKLNALGYQPQISLKEGLRLTVQWYDQNQPVSP